MTLKKYQGFTPGDTIIREGDPARFIYILVEGSAAAYQHGVKIGDIPTGEIFGALATLSGINRDATVKATSHCRVEALTKDGFIAVARQNPELCIGLISDMAELIRDMNDSLAILTSEQPA